MQQWQYLAVNFSDKSIWVDPARQFVLDWLKQKYPHAKITIHKRVVRAVLDFQSSEEAGEAYYALVDHLGTEGWEPFAAENNHLRLRHSSPKS